MTVHLLTHCRQVLRDRLTHLVAVPTGARLLGLSEFVMLVMWVVIFINLLFIRQLSVSSKHEYEKLNYR